jgi:ribonuclease HII
VRPFAPRAAERLTVEPDQVRRPVSYTPRRGSVLTGYERVLVRAGLGPVAGLDEAGRGACAGPLVVAAVAIDRLGSSRLGSSRVGSSRLGNGRPGSGRHGGGRPAGGRFAGEASVELADSKALTARAREAAFRRIMASALAWSVVVIEPGDIDRYGLHVCNVAGMRRALAGLPVRPGFALTDGFEVPGLAVPALAMWKGDQVAACVAAASIVAKVTRDRIMRTLHAEHPEYGFARNKGYSTPGHMAALDAHGPSSVHRRSFVNVLCRLGDGAGPNAGQYAMPGDEDVCVDVDASGDGPIVELTVGSAAAAGLAGSVASATAAGLAGPRVRARSGSTAPAVLEGRR